MTVYHHIEPANRKKILSAYEENEAILLHFNNIFIYNA